MKWNGVTLSRCIPFDIFNIVKFKQFFVLEQSSKRNSREKKIRIKNIFWRIVLFAIMPLYSVVTIKKWKTKFVVKTAWCKGMNRAKVKKFGCRRTTERTIFYSPNLDETPNFSLPIHRDFDLKQKGCYKGFVLKTFSEYFSSFFFFFYFWNI